MKYIIGWIVALVALASIRADDALIIIREYRPFCRSRITEIIRVPKIEPIDGSIAPARPTIFKNEVCTIRAVHELIDNLKEAHEARANVKKPRSK